MKGAKVASPRHMVKKYHNHFSTVDDSKVGLPKLNGRMLHPGESIVRQLSTLRVFLLNDYAVTLEGDEVVMVLMEVGSRVGALTVVPLVEGMEDNWEVIG